jgi:hypothetical protein
METTHPIALTPEQIAVINEGGGFARVEDPTTHRIFLLIEQPAAPTLDDDYVREKLAEARAESERGDVADWDVEKLKRELRDRLAKPQSRR